MAETKKMSNFINKLETNSISWFQMKKSSDLHRQTTKIKFQTQMSFN